MLNGSREVHRDSHLAGEESNDVKDKNLFAKQGISQRKELRRKCGFKECRNAYNVFKLRQDIGEAMQGSATWRRCPFSAGYFRFGGQRQ